MTLDHLPQPMKRYQVRVADNWHAGDRERIEAETYVYSEYETLGEAEAACRTIVDESIRHCLRSQRCITAEALYKSYCSGGNDPYIYPIRNERQFSAWDYAEKRSKEIFQIECSSVETDGE